MFRRQPQDTSAIPTDKPRRSRFLRVVSTVLVSFLVIYTGLSVFGAVAAIPLARVPIEGSPADVGLNYQDVAFPTREDSLALKGWFIPGDGECAIIVVHGGRQNRIDPLIDTLALARDLHAQGLDLLLFDLRGRGESEGNGRTLSNIDRDLGGALDYVKSRGFATTQIGLLGFCSGAANAAIFASHEPVGALALVGCFASVDSMVHGQAARLHIPSLLVDMFLPGVRFAANVLYGYREVQPVDAVRSIGAPILFIHEQHDELTDFDDTRLLLSQSPNPYSSLWEIPGALHSEGYKDNPADFVERVSVFFNASCPDNQ